MGNVFSNFVNQLRNLFGKSKIRIIMIGLDNAGKSTILFQLKFNSTVPTIPTMGFNVETVEYKNVSLVVWDVGGQEKIRHLWSVYSANSGGIIYVVDSADPKRLDESKQELHNVLNDETLRSLPLLVFCNKQDIVGCCSVTEVKEKLGLDQITSRNWYVQPAIATKGEGLKDGLDWFVIQLKRNPFMPKSS